LGESGKKGSKKPGKGGGKREKGDPEKLVSNQRSLINQVGRQAPTVGTENGLM